MARFDDPEYGEYYVEDPGNHEHLNNLLFENDGDPRAQELFTEAFFNDNDQAYQDLVDYLWDVYGLDFEDAFDWEDFRAWYDAA